MKTFSVVLIATVFASFLCIGNLALFDPAALGLQSPKLQPPSMECSWISLPTGDTLRLQHVGRDSVLFNKQGCRIIAHQGDTIIFTRLNRAEDPIHTFFDQPFHVHVSSHLRLCIAECYGAVMDLKGNSDLTFIPTDSYHDREYRPLYFRGDGLFDLTMGGPVVIENLRVSAVTGYMAGLKIHIQSRSGDSTILVEAEHGNFEILTAIPPQKLAAGTRAIFTKTGRLIETSSFRPPSVIIGRDLAVFDITSLSLAGYLRALVELHGLRGFSVSPGVDTSKRITTGQVAKYYDLNTELEAFQLPLRGDHFSIKGDSILYSDTCLHSTGFRKRLYSVWK